METKPVYITAAVTPEPYRRTLTCLGCRRPLGTVLEDAEGHTYLVLAINQAHITGRTVVKCPICGAEREFHPCWPTKKKTFPKK